MVSGTSASGAIRRPLLLLRAASVCARRPGVAAAGRFYLGALSIILLFVSPFGMAVMADGLISFFFVFLFYFFFYFFFYNRFNEISAAGVFLTGRPPSQSCSFD